MIAGHEIVSTYSELDLQVNGKKHAIDLTVTSNAVGGAVIAFTLNKKRFKITINDLGLARHLFFTSGRSARDASISPRYFKQEIES